MRRISLTRNLNGGVPADQFQFQMGELLARLEDYLNNRVDIHYVDNNNRLKILPTLQKGDLVFDFTKTPGVATLQQWNGQKLIPLDINTIIGPPGADGMDGAPGVDGTNGVDGTDGIDGTNGTPGIDGREIELQEGVTHIQWRYVGEPAWNDLIAIADLVGPAGADGVDGVAGSDGPPGADGAPGVDGNDGAPGADGTDGTNGTDGTDGTDGADGSPGPGILYGSGVPSNAIGVDDQLYFDTIQGDIYYKVSGTWVFKPSNAHFLQGKALDSSVITPSNGDMLIYDSTILSGVGGWKVEPASGGGGGSPVPLYVPVLVTPSFL